jgi:hypothetical protein
MDCTNPIFNLDVKKELDLISEIEEITRNLTFDLHNCRAVANPSFFLFEEIADFNAQMCMFRFLKYFSFTLPYYLCNIIHILLFITTDI